MNISKTIFIKNRTPLNILRNNMQNIQKTIKYQKKKIFMVNISGDKLPHAFIITVKKLRKLKKKL